MITVIGTRGTVTEIDVFVQQLLLFSEKEHFVIQAVDASVVYGVDHLVSASWHALRAFEQKTNATNSLALEVLLYAAGERQIQKALRKMGVKKGKQTIAFIMIDQLLRKRNRKQIDSVVRKLLKTFDLVLDSKVLEGNRNTLTKFGITNQEMTTIPESKLGELILEKVALVDVIK